jgi:hypothetical protein
MREFESTFLLTNNDPTLGGGTASKKTYEKGKTDKQRLLARRRGERTCSARGPIDASFLFESINTARDILNAPTKRENPIQGVKKSRLGKQMEWNPTMVDKIVERIHTPKASECL